MTAGLSVYAVLKSLVRNGCLFTHASSKIIKLPSYKKPSMLRMDKQSLSKGNSQEKKSQWIAAIATNCDFNRFLAADIKAEK